MYFKDCIIWTYYPPNKKCYRLFVTKKTWVEARDRCRRFPSGELASIPNPDTQNFLNNELDANNCWFGGKPTNQPDNGTWEWLDGTPWSWTHWMTGHPNKAEPNQRLFYKARQGRDWISRSGSVECFFMCQYDKP